MRAALAHQLQADRRGVREDLDSTDAEHRSGQQRPCICTEGQVLAVRHDSSRSSSARHVVARNPVIQRQVPAVHIGRSRRPQRSLEGIAHIDAVVHQTYKCASLRIPSNFLLHAPHHLSLRFASTCMRHIVICTFHARRGWDRGPVHISHNSVALKHTMTAVPCHQ